MLSTDEIPPGNCITIPGYRKLRSDSSPMLACPEGVVTMMTAFTCCDSRAGHNGAGKTTAISILTGMLAPTSGDAVMNGRSILTDMPSIRADLGCCPQFDILWPEITVLEHLSIYAAIKGFRGQDAKDAAAAAAAEVGERPCLCTL